MIRVSDNSSQSTISDNRLATGVPPYELLFQLTTLLGNDTSSTTHPTSVLNGP